MKIFFTILVLFFSLSVNAADYYFANSGNDNNPGTLAAPFQTLLKLQSKYNAAVAGDRFFLHVNESYDGNLVLNRSGTTAFPIIIASWGGAGQRPIINGLIAANPSGWYGGNNLYTNNTTFFTTPRFVVKNGVFAEIGRWPNVNSGTERGYLNATVTGGNTDASFKWSDNSASNFRSFNTNNINFVGSRVIHRTAQFLMDTGIVTAQTYNSSTGRTTFTASVSGSPTKALSTGWGYFFVNTPDACDRDGEWYYNTSTHKITMYSTIPLSNSIVELPKYDILLSINNCSNVTISGISFRGGNSNVVNITGCTNVSMINCDESFAGKQGIFINNSNNTRIINTNAFWSAGIGVWTYKGGNTLLSGLNVFHSGDYLSMTYPGGANIMPGISLETTGTILEKSIIKYTGWAGVLLGTYSNMTVRNCYASYSQLQLSDCAPFYVIGGSNPLSAGRNLLIENCISEFEAGETFQSIAGTNEPNPYFVYVNFYADNYTKGLTIRGCTAINGYLGIYLHHASDITVDNNLIYNPRQIGIYLKNDRENYVTGMQITNNTVFTTGSSRGNPVSIANDRSTTPLTYIGTFYGNKYFRGRAPGQTFHVTDNLVKATYNTDGTVKTPSSYRSTNWTFSQWKSVYSWDANASDIPPVSYPSSAFETVFKIKYNASDVPVFQRLGGITYKGHNNVIYDDTLTLAPYKAMALSYVSESSNYLPANPGDTIPAPPTPTILRRKTKFKIVP